MAIQMTRSWAKAFLAVLTFFTALSVAPGSSAREQWFRHNGRQPPDFVEAREDLRHGFPNGVVITPPPNVLIYGVTWDAAEREYRVAYSSDNMRSGCDIWWSADHAPDIRQEELNVTIRGEPPDPYTRAQGRGEAVGPISYVDVGSNVAVRWWSRTDGRTTWHSFTGIAGNDGDLVLAHRACWAQYPARARELFDAFSARIE